MQCVAIGHSGFGFVSEPRSGIVFGHGSFLRGGRASDVPSVG